MAVQRFYVPKAEYLNVVLVQRKAETHPKRERGRELPCKVKFRSVLLLQLTAVETCTTYALSYLVILGKTEVGISLPWKV